MKIQSSQVNLSSKKFASSAITQESCAPILQEPKDEFTFSGSGDNAGKVILGLCVGMLSIPVAIGTKSPALAMVGAVTGLAIGFGLFSD